MLNSRMLPVQGLKIDPADLSGEIWGISVFFNPAGYQNKIENFTEFRRRVQAQGLKLLVVELVFGESPYSFEKTDADRLVQLRSHSVLWQKERLLNVAIQNLPPECDQVVWLDGDIIFSDPDWVSKTSLALQKYPVVQPFAYCLRLNQNQKPESVNPDDFVLGPGNGKKMHSLAYALTLAEGSLTFHVGYAWAARRSFLMECGFFDLSILGGADRLMASAFADVPISLAHLPASLRKCYEEWRSRVVEKTRGVIGHVDGMVYHLWHGDSEGRAYRSRYEILRRNGYDPGRDLVLNAQGAYEWGSSHPAFHAEVLGYFHSREEEGRPYFDLPRLLQKPKAMILAVIGPPLLLIFAWILVEKWHFDSTMVFGTSCMLLIALSMILQIMSYHRTTRRLVHLRSKVESNWD